VSELLALLTPGAPEIQADVIRGTAKNKITARDVASCLCRLDRYTYLYALSKFCLDDSSRQELNALSVQSALSCGYAIQETEPDDVISRLGLAALGYAISSSRCRSCNGTGEVKVSSKVVVCGRCGGSGNEDMSVRKLSRVLGVGRWRAQKVWMARFKLLVSDYQMKDDAVQVAIKMGLRDE
jgi:hypothetical protein